MRKNKSLLVGGSIITFLLILAIIGPLLPFVKEGMEPEAFRLVENGITLVPPYSPSSEFLIGSDGNGVDLLSRAIIGTRETLIIVLGITLLRFLLAIPLGILGSFFKTANFILQSWKQLLSFVPTIFMIVFFANAPYLVFAENRFIWMVLLIAIIDVGRISDIIRTQAVFVSKTQFVEAGITVGTRPFRLFRKYYWPQLLPHVIVNAVNDIGRNMFIIGQLGVINIFISLKIQSTEDDTYQILNTSNAWPQFFENVSSTIRIYPWIPLTACLFICITTIGFYIFGEGLRKYFITLRRA
ncbi:hypothetical protein IM538_01100 [Cytobacillus suaedae]|nr:hypothetical protein IM538_01100 [Cytobacillus suaedae]